MAKFGATSVADYEQMGINGLVWYIPLDRPYLLKTAMLFGGGVGFKVFRKTTCLRAADVLNWVEKYS